MKQIEIKYMKYFVIGTLKGLTYDETIKFDSLDSATDHMNFLLAHWEKPVKAFGGSDYTCHVIRMDTI